MPSTPDSTEPPPRSDRPPYLVPGRLPAGVRIQRTFLRGGGHDGEGWTGVVGVERSGRWEPVARVLVAGVTSDREVGDSERRGMREVDVNGHRARLSDNALTGAAVDWFTGTMAVTVVAPPGLADDALGVARAVRLGRSPGETLLGPLPGSYETIVSFTQPAGPRRSGYTISLLGDALGASATISVDLVGDEPDGADLSLVAAVGDSLERRSIRDRPGWLARSRHRGAGRSFFEYFSVAWIETPGTVVSVAGTLPEADLTAIVDGLRETDEDTWRAVVNPDG